MPIDAFITRSFSDIVFTQAFIFCTVYSYAAQFNPLAAWFPYREKHWLIEVASFDTPLKS